MTGDETAALYAEVERLQNALKEALAELEKIAKATGNSNRVAARLREELTKQR